MIPLKLQKRKLRPFLLKLFLIPLKEIHLSLMQTFTKCGYDSSSVYQMSPEQMAGKKETLTRAPIGP